MVTGSSRIAPYLIVRGAQRAIAFYRAAFGATESGGTLMPDGRIGHCELTIGGSHVYVADEFPPPEFESIVGPESLSGTTVIIHLEVDDVPATFSSAVRAGAVPV